MYDATYYIHIRLGLPAGASTQHPGNEFRVVNLLAVDAVIFDFLENAGIALMIRQFPHRIDFVAGLTSAFNILKWVMVGLAVLLVLVSVVVFIIKRKHLTIIDYRLPIFD